MLQNVDDSVKIDVSIINAWMPTSKFRLLLVGNGVENVCFAHSGLLNTNLTSFEYIYCYLSLYGHNLPIL